MSDTSFETALGTRVDEMLDACTRCGKCVEVCPSVTPAGIADANSKDIISGILDILRTGDGPEASRKWAAACMLSGECIKACDYGVNPRFLLAMANIAIAKSQTELPERRRKGLTLFRDDSRDVTMLSQLQLDREVLERLGQKSASAATPAEAPDFVFYVEMSGRMGANSIEKMSHSNSGQVISWCPSCYVQFTETTIPAIERQGGARPFEMTPFLLFLRDRLAQLTPLLRREVKMRIALHRHPGVAGVMEAAAEILQAIPGIEIVDLQQPAVGLQSNNLRVLPAFKRELQRNELQAASDAGIDALVAVYHSDHRELCAHERDWPFRIINMLEVVGASMGLHRDDRYKELKLMQDADLIVAECKDLIAQHSLDVAMARSVIAKGMLGDQPLPLK
jgi:heterodisulfide reductase subunit D